MITVISPAKTLDFETPSPTRLATVPDFLDESAMLIRKLRSISQKQLMSLMDISQDLAKLNVARYLQFEEGASAQGTKQALLAFDGDVYSGIEAPNFSEADFEFAQAHLRILSGLYGLLRPMDLIQPYRLEMGTRLKVGRKSNLYQFWDDRITQRLNEAIAQSGSPVLVNLASQEYFGAVNTNALKAKLIVPLFLDRKGSDYKVVSFWAKKARGKMTAWIIANRLDEVDELKDFDQWGYRFNPGLSDETNWTFTREIPVQ
jgi:uncharacterized protein